MLNLVVGVVAFGVTLLLFKLCRPQHGKVRPFVGTEWEPYVAVGLTVSLVVSAGLTGAGLISLVL
jgi:hypothetical protein